MPSYKAPLENMRFILHDVLGAAQLAELPGYEQATEDLMNQIMEEGGKICEGVLFPLNQSGDKEGCTFENGAVRTPSGFKDAYKTYTEGGWTALSADPAYAQDVLNTAEAVKEALLKAGCDTAEICETPGYPINRSSAVISSASADGLSQRMRLIRGKRRA